MREFKGAIGIRGDMLYCPLPVYIDPYWTCEPNCWHCYSRRLNKVWGWDFRAANPDKIYKRLKNPRGTSSVSQALQRKKTIRIGNKADPFQPWEEEYKISTKIVEIMRDLDWEIVIQTRFPRRVYQMVGDMLKPNDTVMGVISPGMSWDQMVLERDLTEPVQNRLWALYKLQSICNVGVNGEPFIPGLHSIKGFKQTLRNLKMYGIDRYNTYNLHLNEHVAKNLHYIGLDIEKIWEMNQDHNWRPIQKKLVSVAEKMGVTLGCPDFINTGLEDLQKANTCCGINVTNPCKFNTHYWKYLYQKGEGPEEIVDATWEEIGDLEHGKRIIYGTDKDFYTLKDIV